MVITYKNGVAIVKCLYNTPALRAPPPFAWPSKFVMITNATSTLSLKALAYQYTQTSTALIVFVITVLKYIVHLVTKIQSTHFFHHKIRKKLCWRYDKRTPC